MKKMSIFTMLFAILFSMQTIVAKDSKTTKEKAATKNCCATKSASSASKENCDKKTAHSTGKDDCCKTKKKS